MKIFLSALLLSVLAINVPAQNRHSNCSGSTTISLYIPGIFVKAASLFVSKKENATARNLLLNSRSVSLCIKEGRAYVNNHSATASKKMNLLSKQNFEPLITVLNDHDRVSIQMKQDHRKKIKQLAIIADDGENTYAFVRIRCRFTQNELNDLLAQLNSGHDHDLFRNNSLRSSN